ncbi:MAG TPA: hypothetical protein VN328_10430 [Thermodesulfovibrionales bacterium]|nr:hypothetical protein [Thermodesulfovibrionales bacterium]
MSPLGSTVPYDVFVEGEPNLNILASKGGLFIWKTGNSWHVRVARLNVPRVIVPRDVFIASIVVENGILTTDKRIPRLPDEMRIGLNDIFFRFEVEREVKGLDFTVRPTTGFAYCVNFEFQINNVISPEFAYIGRTMFSPVPMPLKICIRR